MFRRFLFQSARPRPSYVFPNHKPASRGTKFSTSIPRTEFHYVRFGTPKQPNEQPKNPYDFRTWDTRVQIATALALGGGIYYVSQYVSAASLASLTSFAEVLSRYQKQDGGDS
jgi:hypothetical protein